MKYQGSKARIAKDISPIINKLIKDNDIRVYVEPFVGGANMIEHIECANKYGYDNNSYLIDFWNSIINGWQPLAELPPKDMTRELYEIVKKHKEWFPSDIVALVGFCSTYNAKWFGGYAGTVKTKVGTFRNYYDEAVRNVMKQAERIKDVVFINSDYKNLTYYKNSLIYCDPPYEGTTGYHNSFDHQTYWEWVRKMSENNIVLCSEYSAPPDFECIWQKQLTTTLDKSSRSKAVEKLFVLKKVV